MATEDHLEWHAVAEEVRRRLASAAARHRYATADALLPRFASVAAVHSRLELLRGVEALEAWPGAKGSLGADLQEVVDVAPIVDRARRGSDLSLEELAHVCDLTEAAFRIAQRLGAIDAAWLERASASERDGLRALLAAQASLRESSSLPAELARSLERTGDLRLADAASTALGPLRVRAIEARRAVVAEAERMLRTPEVERGLADRYWTERQGRVVLPVRSDAFSRAAGSVSGIIHASSGSGQTLFVEPHGLVDFGNAHRQATMAVHTEERRILARLSRRIGEESELLTAWARDLCDLDRLRAALGMCRALDAVEPTVVEASAAAPGLALPGARHPLMVLRGTDVVASDLVVAHGGALVISGPNAGGKTVALKTIGLCALMAQAGLRVPTGPGAQVPLVRHVVADVGDDQSIAADLSTFSAHIGHVREALECAAHDGPGTLVLLDEIAVGTEPEQGAALAESILLALVERGATVVVTTHYERLKLLASRLPGRFINAAVGFDLEALLPTFRVSVGAPGSSSALAVAGRLGLDAGVLERARALLGAGALELDNVLREVQVERERLAVGLESLAGDRRRLTAERERLLARDLADEERAAAARAAAHRAAAIELRKLHDEIRNRRKALQRGGEPPADAAAPDGLDARSFAKHAQASLRATGSGTLVAPDAAAALTSARVGDRVRVAGFDADGEILAVRGGKVTVQLAGLKTTVPLRQVGKPPRSTGRPAQPRREPERASEGARHFGSEPMPVTPGVDNVVDIRGVRAEAAVTMVEVFLDRALCEAVETVIVRHGHGSGALRKAIREHLPRLGHVRRHRAGLPGEGGDAVTVIWVHA